MVKLLGIETSCDETAAALVGGDKTVHARLVRSQLKEHAVFGGVVPEIAARAHLEVLPKMIEAVLQDAGLSFNDMDGIAATTGPGLIGGLIVGATLAKTLAMSIGKPFYAVNHLEGHILSARLTDDVDFPYLALLVSGGHSQFVLVKNVGDYQLLGTTLDDAAGEAFDKVAKILNLGFPGGPALEKLAVAGNRTVDLPRPLFGKPGCDFSFAGLKTAVLYAAQSGLHAPSDIARSFQDAVVDVLVDRTRHALDEARGVRALAVVGGVAANKAIRSALESLAFEKNIHFTAPPLRLCGDNADMIAWAALERLKTGLAKPDSYDAPCRPRWPLQDMPVGK